MYDIEMQEMTRDFYDCWRAAGMHLNRQVDGGIRFWLRAHHYPPFLEHLSFRLGNQVFLVRVQDADEEVVGPGSLDGLMFVSRKMDGRPCILPMRRHPPQKTWIPTQPGWGLVDAENGASVDPVMLVTDAQTEMTPWELQDLAVQIVRDDLDNKGFHLMSWQGNPEVDPSIWFIGASGAPEWVIVRAAVFPEKKAEPPKNWLAIAQRCSSLSNVGYFASVAIENVDQAATPQPDAPLPLWRGYPLEVNFDGLEPLSSNRSD